MDRKTGDKSFRAGLCRTLAQADQAVHELLAVGFSREEVAVVCPQQYRSQMAGDLQHAERPGSHAAAAIVEGGAIGAALGGLTLAVAAIGTGGVAILPAIPVLLGGGAFAGIFGSLIAADGYGKGIGERYQQAIQEGQILVGVEIHELDATPRLAKAERILGAVGAELVWP